MAGEPWPAIKERHLLQIAGGPRLPPTAYQVAIILSSHLNSKTVEAFPSELTMARRVGLDVGADEPDKKKRARKKADSCKTVRRGVKALVAAGHYIVEERNGHLFYRPVFCEAELPHAPLCEAELPQARGKAASGARQNCRPNLTTEPEKEPGAASVASRKRTADGVPPDLRPELYGLPADAVLTMQTSTRAIFVLPNGERVEVKRR